MDIDFVLEFNLLVQVDDYQAYTNRIYVYSDQQQLDIFCKRCGPGFHDQEKITVKSSSRCYNAIINAFVSNEVITNINFLISNRLMS